MKVKTVFVFLNQNKPEAHATIDVPGLGEVKIVEALSTRLCEEIRAEAVLALRVKMGQQIQEKTEA
jgi:hypothetical protein